jgi:F-type H+-transporting ATPase subunit delta
VASQSGRFAGLASRYASALYDLAEEGKSLDKIAEDLRTLNGLLAESDDLRRLVRSPVLRRDDQVKALQAVAAASGLDTLTTNFLCLVARNRRLFALGAMIEEYLRILAERRGEVPPHVAAAHALNDRQVEQITDALRQMVGGKVSVETTVDPSLLGGLVVRVGSRMFDSSLRTKLQRLQLAMKGVG